MLKILVALCVAMLCVMPVLGDGGGGGGGGEGVWILPRSLDLTNFSAAPTGGTPAVESVVRSARTLVNITRNLTMRLPSEMGQANVRLVEYQSHVSLPVSAVGHDVTLPMRTLIAVRDSVSGRADGLIQDAAGRGFVFQVLRNADRSVEILVY